MTENSQVDKSTQKLDILVSLSYCDVTMRSLVKKWKTTDVIKTKQVIYQPKALIQSLKNVYILYFE